MVNKAIMLANTGKQDEAVTLLGALILDPSSPRDIEAIAKKTLAMILENG